MTKLYYILVVLICAVGFAETGIYPSFNSGELSPELHGRIDALKFYSGCRVLENMFIWSQGPVEKRNGTYFVGEVGGEIFPAVPAIPGAAATYKTTYFSEVGAIWGVPLNFTTYATLNLDSSGVARDVGGGIVALPCLGHPFVEGQVIRIEGSTNYDGTPTLTSGTSSTELQFTDTFGAETFDGTETVVQYISLSAGVGRMDQDSDGNIYYGRIGGCTKISVDGTIDTTFYSSGNSATAIGVRVSSDSDYVYIAMGGAGWSTGLKKRNTSDGSEVWSVAAGGTGYNIDIDSDDNVYVCKAGTSGTLAKFTASDGTETDMTDMEGVYDVHVDNALDVVLVGGWERDWAPGTGLYNLAIRTLDNSDGTQIALGGLYDYGSGIVSTYIIGTGHITSYDGYIYVLCNRILYKLDTDLNIIAQTATITYATGLFVDLRGQIVVVYQDYASYQDDIFWFYDTDLNYITKTEHDYYDSMLSSWAATIGGSWVQGNVVFDGNLGTADIPAVPAVEAFSNGLADVPPARLLSFEYNEGDSYIIEAGAGYFRFYKDIK